MYFSDSKGNKIDPAHLGIEHEAIDGAYDVTIFEDSRQILDKLAALVAGLAQAK